MFGASSSGGTAAPSRLSALDDGRDDERVVAVRVGRRVGDFETFERTWLLFQKDNTNAGLVVVGRKKRRR